MSSARSAFAAASASFHATSNDEEDEHTQQHMDAASHDDAHTDATWSATDAELIAELDERAAADDERLWLTYQAQELAEGRVPDPALNPLFDAEDGSTPGSRSVPAELRAAIPTLSPADLALRVTPTADRSWLSPQQAAIAAELTIIDHSTPPPQQPPPPRSRSAVSSRTAAVVPPAAPAPASSIRSQCHFSLVHPLWIQHGRKQVEAAYVAALKRVSDETERKLSEAADVGSSGAVAAAAPAPPPEEPPSTAVTSRNVKTPSTASTARRISGNKMVPGGGDETAKGRKGASSAAAAAAAEPVRVPPPPLKERALGHGAALVAAREAQELERQRTQHPPVPQQGPIRMPANETWHVQLRRVGVNDSSADCDLELSLGFHSLLVSQRRSASGFLHRAYSFDGQRFRHSFEEGVERGVGGWIEDVLRADLPVWQAARRFLDEELLAPLAMPRGREGWCLFFDEWLPWETCGVHVQLLRTLYDGDGEQQQQELMRKTMARPDTAVSGAAA